MRQIATLPSESDARTLADYLLTLDIATRIDGSAEGWELWVCDEDRVPRAREELDAFRRDPNDPRYRDAVRTARAIQQKAERDEEQYRRNVIDVRRRWGSPPTARQPLTLLLMAVSVTVFLLPYLGVDAWSVKEPLFIASKVWTNKPENSWENLFQVAQGQVWRLVTPIFLHFGILHIVFNMMCLNDLGRQIEARRGSLRFGLLVLAAAVLSNLAQFLVSGPGFGGMSGVVYGLFGYLWMKTRYEPESGLFIHPQTVTLMLVWFVVCLVGIVPGIANTAHGVGLAVGVAVGLAPRLWRRRG